MQKWNLGRGDPLSLTLACDPRLGEEPAYTNDQIWELTLGEGEPPALAMQTSYGLRARSMRVFPQFTELKNSLIDPQAFQQPPLVHQFFPNFVSLSCSPFLGIDVSMDLWVPESQSIAGRFTITNHSIVPRQIEFDLVGLLSPLDEGECMAANLMGVTPVLSGKTAELYPVLFLTGGPEAGSGPYPSLRLNLDLLPGNQRQFTWCLATLSDPELSFGLARKTTARRWDAEAARIQQVNAAHQVEIITGDPDWDAALAFSQKTAFRLFTRQMPGLPNRSFVQAREPDQGYSRREDGSDYPHQWNGQSALDVYYLLGYLLPGAVDLAAGLFCNFLATQTDEGKIDWKPGPGGQRGLLHAQPILASLAWRIYRAQPDLSFLERVYPALLRYLDVWFDVEHDRDSDCIPEWDHPFQTGLDDHPLFDHWHPEGKGIDVSTVEDPGLAAMLAQECRVLLLMAELLKEQDGVERINRRSEKLVAFLETSWDPRLATYRLRDRETHTRPRVRRLGKRKGPGVVRVEQDFDPPCRLTIRIQSGGDTTRLPVVRVLGENGAENIEEQVTNRGMMWIQHQLTLTTQEIYTRVDRVEVDGLSANDKISLQVADLNVETLAAGLPLWAHVPDVQRARRMIEKNLFNPSRYGQPYGLPTCPASENRVAPQIGLAVHPLLNSLIGEGLMAYGYQAQSAQLVTHMMEAIIHSLKTGNAFRTSYRADTGEGMGETNNLLGLAPLGLFLQTLGVEILSPEQVIVRGNNPFPWPITVKYRGLTLVRREQDTWITFPDGQTSRVPGPDTRLISLT